MQVVGVLVGGGIIIGRLFSGRLCHSENPFLRTAAGCIVENKSGQSIVPGKVLKRNWSHAEKPV